MFSLIIIVLAFFEFNTMVIDFLAQMIWIHALKYCSTPAVFFCSDPLLLCNILTVVYHVKYPESSTIFFEFIFEYMEYEI